jgi:hypothetical protein
MVVRTILKCWLLVREWNKGDNSNLVSAVAHLDIDKYPAWICGYLTEAMVAALLYYKKFMKSLTKQGYKINPCDGYMANKVVKGKQVMICFHIDDCKISHKSSAIIDNTIAWLRTKYKSIFEDVLSVKHCRRTKKPRVLLPL